MTWRRQQCCKENTLPNEHGTWKGLRFTDDLVTTFEEAALVPRLLGGVQGVEAMEEGQCFGSDRPQKGRERLT